MTNTAVPLTVLTLNIHKGFCIRNKRSVLSELRDALQDISADLVFLQEVIGEGGQKPLMHTAHAPAISQYEYLAHQLWSDFAYGRNAVYPSGHHGNAILSRFPILSWQNLDISVGPTEKRGLLHCLIELPCRPACHLVCVHLGLWESHRQTQLERINQFVTTLPPEAPVVVAGDFNDWLTRACQKTHASNLKEVFLESMGNFMKTFPAQFPVLRLDRIYLRNARAFKPKLLPGNPWRNLSDHLPLCAEVVL
jgi:endonuclease/exonuclease/phosphatase family metal-dependent hydrolase